MFARYYTYISLGCKRFKSSITKFSTAKRLIKPWKLSHHYDNVDTAMCLNYTCYTTSNEKTFSPKFSKHSDVTASESYEEMFPQYYMHGDVFSKFESFTTQSSVTRHTRVNIEQWWRLLKSQGDSWFCINHIMDGLIMYVNYIS